MRAYEVRAAADRGELWLYGDIGESLFGGISADQVRKDLKALGPKVKSLDVYVNSPGGDVFEAVAMHTVFSRFGGEVRMSVDAFAASAASVVIMAGTTIAMAEAAMIMIHNPWGMALGEAEDLRSYADSLDRVRDQMVGLYARRTGAEPKRIEKLMAAETWMNAEEAVAEGFADETAPGRKMAASASLPVDWAKYKYRRPPPVAVTMPPLRDRRADVERMAASLRSRRDHAEPTAATRPPAVHSATTPIGARP